MSLEDELGTIPVTIASGASLSSAVDLGGRGIVRIIMDTTWTAAVLTMQASNDGVTYSDLYDATGTEWSATVAANHAVIMDISSFSAMRFLKLRSGTGGTPVAQGAARALSLIVKAF